MKKVLVLGSDYSTKQVVLEAQKLGAYVIVTDLMDSSPTKDVADERWKISTTDTELLIRKCRENNITAILFGASDFNINNARIICKALNIPIYCDKDDTWEISRNKRLFKDLCKKVGVPIADDYYLSDQLRDNELKEILYPVVCKPSDKSGNRGMSFCNSEEELKEGYRLARTLSDEPIIVERQLKGQEYNVHYVVADGEPRLLYFSSTHHEPGFSSNLYSFKCTTSCHLKQFLEENNDAVKRLIRAAGCREGLVWFDCIRDEDGKFYLLEMGYRFGGVMTYMPYSGVSGFNAIKWMVEYALGKQHRIDDLPNELDDFQAACAGSYHLFSKKNTKIKSIDGLEKIKTLDKVYIDMPKGVGNMVRKDACSGLIGIYGSNIEELCSSLEIINDSLYIRDEDGDNVFIKFDDIESLKREYYAGKEEFA